MEPRLYANDLVDEGTLDLDPEAARLHAFDNQQELEEFNGSLLCIEPLEDAKLSVLIDRPR